MKRETLKDKRRYLNKMSYYVTNNEHAQVIDSHLEALDRIDELEAAVRKSPTKTDTE